MLAFSLTILAQTDTKSPAQLCKDWGWGGTPVFDACVNCTAQGGGGGTSSTGVCMCKTVQAFQPDYFAAHFKSLGDCVSQMNRH